MECTIKEIDDFKPIKIVIDLTTRKEAEQFILGLEQAKGLYNCWLIHKLLAEHLEKVQLSVENTK